MGRVLRKRPNQEGASGTARAALPDPEPDDGLKGLQHRTARAQRGPGGRRNPPVSSDPNERAGQPGQRGRHYPTCRQGRPGLEERAPLRAEGPGTRCSCLLALPAARRPPPVGRPGRPRKDRQRCRPGSSPTNYSRPLDQPLPPRPSPPPWWPAPGRRQNIGKVPEPREQAGLVGALRPRVRTSRRPLQLAPTNELRTGGRWAGPPDRGNGLEPPACAYRPGRQRLERPAKSPPPGWPTRQPLRRRPGAQPQ